MSVIANCIAKPRFTRGMKDRIADIRGKYIGDAAQSKRGICALHWPMQDGVVKNWDDMQYIWQYLVDSELRFDLEEDIFGLMLTERALNPRKNREEAAKIWFESFNVPRYHVAVESLLSLTLLSQSLTGLCVDSGDAVTTVTPMVEGYILNDAMWRVPLAGCQVSECMERVMARAGICHFTTSAERMSVLEMKKMCYVAEFGGFDAEVERLKESTDPQQYTLPDGDVLTLRQQLVETPELMFKPTVDGKEMGGLAELVHQAVEDCPLDCRKSMYENIVLCGGNTNFPNMGKRLQQEVQALTRTRAAVKVEDCSSNETCDPMHASWLGGSVLTTTSPFALGDQDEDYCAKFDKWVTKAQYEECGPRIVTEKMI